MNVHNIKIRTKILSIIILLSSVVFISTLNSINEMKMIDKDYSSFLEKDAFTWATVPRVTRSFTQIQLLGYQAIATSDADQIKKLSETLDTTIRETRAFLKDMKNATPNMGDAIAIVELHIDPITSNIKKVIELSIKGDNVAGAVLLKSKIDSEINQALTDVRKVRDLVTQNIKSGSQRLNQSTQNVIYITYALVGIGTLLSVLAALYMAKISLSAPLYKLIATLSELMNGNTSCVVDGTERGDEIGDIARAIDVFKVSLIENARLSQEQEHDQKNKIRRAQHLAHIIDDFEKQAHNIIAHVTTSAHKLTLTAQSMAQISDATNGQSIKVASASEQATQNVNTVATATEELTASIAEISARVSDSTQLIQTAVEQVHNTDIHIKSLADAAKSIDHIAQLIHDIAEQTNMLALNATIEAARAGEAGKGFSIVAAEVKQLANRTAEATIEITNQLQAIQDASLMSTSSTQTISQTVNNISSVIVAIATAIEEQSVATKDIARNALLAAQGTHDVTDTMSDMSHSAQDTASAATHVLQAAHILSENGERLKHEITAFLEQTKAA